MTRIPADSLSTRGRPYGRQITFLFSLLIFGFCPWRATATLFDPLPIESLATEADLVLQGTVLSKSCQRDPAGRIYTRIELQVAEVWKGSIPGSPFIIVHGGGVLGEEQRIVSGQVQYEVGEEVVAFLVRNSRGEGVTLGLMQGKFHVWKDAATGSKYVVSPFHGFPKNALQAMKLKSPAQPGPSSGPLGLAELKKRVREAQR
jgi:hypothetical protein